MNNQYQAFRIFFLRNEKYELLYQNILERKLTVCDKTHLGVREWNEYHFHFADYRQEISSPTYRNKHCIFFDIKNVEIKIIE